MINFFYRLLLTFNSTSLIIVVFLVKVQTVIDWHPKLANIPSYFSYLIYFSIPVLLTYLSLILARFLSDDSLEKENKISKIAEVEQANNAFLPSYLGYFFVALSVPYGETLIFVFFILFVFTFFSQTLYFNPLFLLFGYKFYYLTTTNRIKVFLITKKTLKDPTDIDLPALKRINDFTFIDKGN
jgi:hypothetical protein